MNQFSFPAISLTVILAFFLFSSEECKQAGDQEDNIKTEFQENPKTPEKSTPPKNYQPPEVDTSSVGITDSDCIEKTEEQHKLPCPDVYDPVCGCDGKNYPNPCSAKRAGIKKWEKGRCN